MSGANLKKAKTLSHKITNQGDALWPTVLIDFDGVIHGYQSGWLGVDQIPDPPVPGAIQWLTRMVGRFDVRIFSARCNDPKGIEAMKFWLRSYGIDFKTLSLITFEPGKPSAHLIIDDRAMRFKGAFPEIDEVENYKPWYKYIPGYRD